MLYNYVGSQNTILYNLCTAGRLDTLIVCDNFLDSIVDTNSLIIAALLICFLV